MTVLTGAIVLKKSVFRELNGFNPQLKLGEDFDLLLRVALKYKVAFVNKFLANYNQDVDMKWRAVGNLHKPENHILFNLDIYDDYTKIIPELKQLLDNLRVYGLMPYYLNNTFENKVLI